MLEIIFVIVLCRGMGRLLRSKDRKPLLFQILLVVAWIGGEFLGGVVGGVIHVVQHGDAPFEPGLPVYLLALAGAASGAGLMFLIAWLLPPAYQGPVASSQFTGQTFQLPEDADRNNPYIPPTTGN
jgi:hypothetical protein